MPKNVIDLCDESYAAWLDSDIRLKELLGKLNDPNKAIENLMRLSFSNGFLAGGQEMSRRLVRKLAEKK